MVRKVRALAMIRVLRRRVALIVYNVSVVLGASVQQLTGTALTALDAVGLAAAALMLAALTVRGAQSERPRAPRAAVAAHAADGVTRAGHAVAARPRSEWLWRTRRQVRPRVTPARP